MMESGLRIGHLASLGCAVSLLAMGCSSEDAVFAEQAADSTNSVVYEAAFIVHAMDGMTASVLPEDAANANAANVGNFWSAGCTTPTIDGPTVSYVLDACEGPFGMTAVSGNVSITYRESGSSYGFDITSTDLMVGTEAVTLTVMADVSTDGRNVSVTSSGTLTSQRGHTLSRSGSYDLGWNPGTECAGIATGSWDTTVLDATHSTSVANFRRCGDTCAQAGAVTYNGVTLQFDGSTTATFTSGSGASGAIGLFCTAS